MCDKDSYYLGKAFQEADNSRCLRHRVGTILVKNDKILVSACNNVSRGMSDCEKLGCLRRKLNLSGGERAEECRGVHSEQELIIKCVMLGINPEGATVYCTHSPCSICAKMLANLKIKCLVYANERVEKKFVDIFKSAGVEYRMGTPL